MVILTPKRGIPPVRQYLYQFSDVVIRTYRNAGNGKLNEGNGKQKCNGHGKQKSPRDGK